MAAQCLDMDLDEEVNAAFMRNHRGAVCIAFSDPSYVRADAILVDRASGAVHAVLHENSCLIGHVSGGMVRAFTENREVLLTALRPDGTVFELVAPVHANSS